MASLLHRHGKRFAALTLIAGAYWMTILPEISEAERARLSSRFAFAEAPLPDLVGDAAKQVRTVHPSLQRIATWISSVGASVALADLDGDGLPNDTCFVDTRGDAVVVAPVPGTPSRYTPFQLHVAPLRFDATTMAPMGCMAAELTGDADRDLIVYFWGRPPVAFLRRPGPLSLDRFVPTDIVDGTTAWYTNAATMADLDGDGHDDLVVANYFPDGARILDARSDTPPQHMQQSMSRAANGGAKHVLLWAGGHGGDSPVVRFVSADDAIAPPWATGWALAIAAVDLDGDLRPELYIANDFGPDHLLHNRSASGVVRFVPLIGRKTFTTPSSKTVGRDSFKGMGVDAGDINDDGLLDLFVSNIAAEYALEESHFAFLATGDIGLMRDGIAPFVDRSEALGLSRSGWAWDAKLADFDNDSHLEVMQATGFVRGTVDRWPELHELAMGNDTFLQYPGAWPRFQPGDGLSGAGRVPFFVRDRTGRYADIAGTLGLVTGDISRGLAIADVDGDGLLDFGVANQWGTSRLYRNTSARTHAFLGLHLLRCADESTSSHAGHPAGDACPPAIGAAATVWLPDGRRLVGHVDGGNGHAGRRSPDVHFGLGDPPDGFVVTVDLRWRAQDGRSLATTLRLPAGWHTVRLAGL